MVSEDQEEDELHWNSNNNNKIIFSMTTVHPYTSTDLGVGVEKCFSSQTT